MEKCYNYYVSFYKTYGETNDFFVGYCVLKQPEIKNMNDFNKMLELLNERAGDGANVIPISWQIICESSE